MLVKFSSNKLEKKLSEPRLIKKFYSKHYKNIILRLSELYAADNLEEIPNVPPPRRHKLSNACWGIDYSRNYRFVIEPIGDYDINDKSTITDIKILKLEDYH